MELLISKLTSRKFLTCVAGFVMGLCVVFGVDEGAVSVIAGAITSIASVVSYIITEGKIDAEAVDKVTDGIKDVIDVFEGIEK